LNKKPGTYFTYSNLNFGLCGTFVERLSGIRFDIYARENVLNKLGVEASFNVADLKNITQLATLYSGLNGTWVEEIDGYHGVKPAQRNLTGYNIGNNGLIYGP